MYVCTCGCVRVLEYVALHVCMHLHAYIGGRYKSVQGPRRSRTPRHVRALHQAQGAGPRAAAAPTHLAAADDKGQPRQGVRQRVLWDEAERLLLHRLLLLPPCSRRRRCVPVAGGGLQQVVQPRNLRGAQMGAGKHAGAVHTLAQLVQRCATLLQWLQLLLHRPLRPGPLGCRASTMPCTCTHTAHARTRTLRTCSMLNCTASSTSTGSMSWAMVQCCSRNIWGAAAAGAQGRQR